MNIATSTPTIAPLGQRVARPRILVAEDDAEMRRLVVSTLVVAGYDVTEARDGMELLDIIEAPARRGVDAFAAIVSDIRMPWLSGMDILAAMQVATCRTPVVLITAFGDEYVHAEGHELGAFAVMDKPFEMDRLVQTIARAIEDRLS